MGRLQQLAEKKEPGTTAGLSLALLCDCYEAMDHVQVPHSALSQRSNQA
jgi:hypothetical protein